MYMYMKPKFKGQTLGYPTEILAQICCRSPNADLIAKYVIFNSIVIASSIYTSEEPAIWSSPKFQIKNPRMNMRVPLFNKYLESRAIPGEDAMHGERCMNRTRIVLTIWMIA